MATQNPWLTLTDQDYDKAIRELKGTRVKYLDRWPGRFFVNFRCREEIYKILEEVKQAKK